MSIEDTVKRYKPLKGQMTLFGIEHLKVPLNFEIRYILDYFTIFGKSKSVNVLYLKDNADVELTREWIKQTYNVDSNAMPYLFPKEYFVFWNSTETELMYCYGLGELIKSLKDDIEDLERLAKFHLRNEVDNLEKSDTI